MPDDLIERAQNEYGAILHPLHLYWRGWLCFRIVMIWPLRWFNRCPASIKACAGDYAHDARQPKPNGIGTTERLPAVATTSPVPRL